MHIYEDENVLSAWVTDMFPNVVGAMMIGPDAEVVSLITMKIQISWLKNLDTYRYWTVADTPVVRTFEENETPLVSIHKSELPVSSCTCKKQRLD